jgi:ketosteroid isomerase-like protein
MSQANVEIVHRLYEASVRRDTEACIEMAHPDVRLRSYLMGIEGTYTGYEGMRRFLDDLFTAFPNWHPSILRATDYGEAVVAEVRLAGRGAASGVEIEQTVWQVTTFKDGKVGGFYGYGSRAEALKAVRLEE